MAISWIKQWVEALDDPKLTRLSLAERGAWWGILKLAGKCGAGGMIVSGGQSLDIEEITEALHIKTSEDQRALESMIDKMQERDSLEWKGGHTLRVIHWEERQRMPPSARPEAVADRVRRHREHRKEAEREGIEASPPLGAGPHNEVQPTIQDEEVLRVWSGVKDFPEDSNAATCFLTMLRAEFPTVDILEESKTWAAAKLSAPLTRRSTPFKQLRTWMRRDRDHQSEQAHTVDDDDPCKYTKGRYGHLVRT